MLLAPEAAPEVLAPFTSILFAPDAEGFPPFGCGLGFPGRYSSRDEGDGGGLPPLSLLGDCPRAAFGPLGAGGDSWRERFAGS